MSEPLFSIVIACYNHERFIAEAVESALRQRHPSREIIVVDDASTDGSVEILRSFGDSILVQRLPANRGAGAARNHGASIARGRYLVFLDGDDVLTPWSLQTYARIIEQRTPTLILGRSSLFYGDLPVVPAAPEGDIQFVEYASFLDKDRHWVYNTSSLVVERAAFREVGGWSPDIFYQDIQDLLNKFCATHKTIAVLAPETVFYRMHSSNAVTRVAPFIDGVYRLLAKARQGAYPGGRRVAIKRSAWFGGLIFYWAQEGMRNGPFVDGLKLILINWWMVLFAVIRRAVAWIAGRRPVERLTFEPKCSENPVDSLSVHPLAGSVRDDYQWPATKA